MNTFTLRLATEKDAEAILDIYAPNITRSAISFEETLPSLDEMKSRISKIQEKHLWIVATNSQAQVVGYAYAGPHHERLAYKWSVNVSAYIHQDFRGKGLGKKLYSKLFEILPAQNYYRAYAGITLPNQGSVALHESAGFTHLATYRNVGFKMGRWQDVGWWERSLKEPVGEPRSPIRFVELPTSIKDSL